MSICAVPSNTENMNNVNQMYTPWRGKSYALASKAIVKQWSTFCSMTYRGATFAGLGVSLDTLNVKNPELPGVATVVQCELLEGVHGHIE